VEAHVSDRQHLRGWNPVRVAQATVALLPVAIAIGGAATQVVVPVAVICALGVVRREQVLRAPTSVQRQAVERAGRVPKAAQAALMTYTLAGFALIYDVFMGPERLAALVAQILIVLAASLWLRSIYNRAGGPPPLLGAMDQPDPRATTSTPPPSPG
jgi:hypothetical protein